MIDRHFDPIQLAEYRLDLGVRIDALFEKNNSYKDYHDIAFYVFNASPQTRPNEYLPKLIAWFNPSEDQLDTVTALIQDAWNYLPHRSLDAKCPAELMAAALRVAE